jgi:hypothetical protein
MTTAQLKRAMDRRFDRLERNKVDKTEFRRAIIDLRRGLGAEMRAEMRRELLASGVETRRYVNAALERFVRLLRSEIAASAAATRRHFDVVAGQMLSKVRVYGDGIAAHTQTVENHETRIAQLERRSN